MKLLDLFSGIGGFSYGLEKLGFKTTAFCEMDKYCKLVLQKHWKGVKIYNDVKELKGEEIIKEHGTIDIVVGGFPCQPFSIAGARKGTDDNRHLWPEMFRIIKIFKSKFVIGENVRGIVNIQNGMVFETVCSDLESEGYEVQPFLIPAAGVGAPHRRERIFFIATNTESERTRENNEGLWSRTSGVSGRQGTSRAKDVGNTQHNGSPTSEIGGRNEEVNGGTEKRENRSFEFEGTSGREDNENMENPRRTLRQGSELRETNEDETRKENADQLERSSGSSESNVADTIERNVEAGRERQRGIRKESQGQGTSSDVTSGGETSRTEDVANTESFRSRETRYSDQEEGSEGSRATQLDGSRRDVANTERQRLEGFSEQSTTIGGQDTRTQFGNESSRGSQSRDVADTVSERGRSRITERQDAEDVRQPSQSSNTGWWDIEPDVGRVAHGVPGRVHRLKGLGNSIIPKIAEEIGRAIIKAEKKGGYYE